MSMATQERQAAVTEQVRERLRPLLPREALWRFFTDQRGVKYCWATESMDGKYASWVYQPVGKGSRSGKPHEWKLTKRVNHKLRKAAKARAYRLYQAEEQR